MIRNAVILALLPVVIPLLAKTLYEWERYEQALVYRERGLSADTGSGREAT